MSDQKKEQYTGEESRAEKGLKGFAEGGIKVFGMQFGGDKEILGNPWVERGLGAVDLATSALTAPGRAVLSTVTSFAHNGRVNEYKWAESFNRRIQGGYKPLPIIGTFRANHARKVVARGYPSFASGQPGGLKGLEGALFPFVR